MKKGPLVLLISMIVIIISMSFLISYQNINAPAPPMGADREGGMIFGGQAPQSDSSISNAEFTPAAESDSSGGDSCD